MMVIRYANGLKELDIASLVESGALMQINKLRHGSKNADLA
jgi:hypothetical protein